MDVDRILRNTPATLTVTFYNDETATDADGAVNVTVTDASGATVASGTATHGAVGSGQYSFNLAAQSALAELDVTWSGTFSAAAGSITTKAEIVGGLYFTLSELRASDASLADAAKYSTAQLRDARMAVEVEFERFCGRAFVPRYGRETIIGDGTDTFWLEHPDIIDITKIDGVVPTIDFRVEGKHVQTADHSVYANDTPYVVEYEYGLSEVPFDIKRAALRRARGLLTGARGRIDERATVMQIPDFGTFTLATPGQRGAMTGIPDIDVVLDAWSVGQAGVL